MKRNMTYLLAGILLSATALASAKPIVVGGKLDPEAQLLSQMIILTLRNAGLEVTDKASLGDTGVNRKAILAGEIDTYAEYTGNAVYLFPDAKITAKQSKNPGVVYGLARRLDGKQGISWLRPANANNTWAVAVPQAFAAQNKLSSYADLAAYLKKGGELKVAGSPEFFNRDDGRHQRRERGHGLRYRRLYCGPETGGAQRPPECPAGVPACPDHPHRDAEGQPPD